MNNATVDSVNIPNELTDSESKSIESKVESNITTEKIDGRILEDFQQYLKTLPINEDKEITLKQLKATPKIAAVWNAFANAMGAKIEPNTIVYTIKNDEKGQFVGNPVIKRKGSGIALIFPKGYSFPIADSVVDSLVVLDRKFVYKPMKLALSVSVIDGEQWDKSSAYSDASELIELIQEDIDQLQISADTKDFTFDIVEVLLEGVSKKTGEPYVMVKVELKPDKFYSYFVPDAKNFNGGKLPINDCEYNAKKREITIDGKKYSTISVQPFNKLAENSTYIIKQLKSTPSKFKAGQLQYIMQLEDEKGDKISAYSSSPIANNLSRFISNIDAYNMSDTDRFVIFTKKLAPQNNGKLSLNAQLDVPAVYNSAAGFFGDENAAYLPW